MFGLHNQINTLMHNGSSIADYYHKLKALRKQYDAMIELPKCVCNSSNGFKKHNQLLKLMQFLMGLDDSYMQIRGSILSREVLHDVRNSYATISSEESYRVAAGSISSSSQRSHAFVFVSNASYNQNNQRNNQTNNNGPSRPNNQNNNRQGGENKVIVTFDENKCYFLNQDLNLKNVMGIGEQCEGLYYYNDQVMKVATHNEEVATLEENVVYEGNLDQSPSSSHDVQNGIDYEETFSPVVKMVTVRCLLHIVVCMSWHVFQLDVNNAFLYGDLEEVVYMKTPERYFPSDNKRKYILDLLSEYGMLACKPVKTLLMSKLVISNEASENDHLLENITDYQKLTEKLIYLTNTRPYISYDVHCLSQFMHSPMSSHLKIEFKILSYLKIYPGLGIHIARTFGMFLNAYSDADWAKCIVTRKSVTSNSAIKRTVNSVFHERTKRPEIDLHFGEGDDDECVGGSQSQIAKSKKRKVEAAAAQRSSKKVAANGKEAGGKDIEEKLISLRTFLRDANNRDRKRSRCLPNHLRISSKAVQLLVLLHETQLPLMKISGMRAHKAEVNARNRRCNQIASFHGSRSLAATRHEYFSIHKVYPSLIKNYFDNHTRNDVFVHPQAERNYNEMLRLLAQGEGTSTGIAMTYAEIVSQVLGGKQRGHLPGRGRKVSGVDSSSCFGSPSQGPPSYSQQEEDGSQSQGPRSYRNRKSVHNPKSFIENVANGDMDIRVNLYLKVNCSDLGFDETLRFGGFVCSCIFAASVDQSHLLSNSDELLMSQWDRCNSVVLSWILGSVTEELYMGQIFSKLAMEVWDELKETYDKIDVKTAFSIISREESHRGGSSNVSNKTHATSFASNVPNQSNLSNRNRTQNNAFNRGKPTRNPNLLCTNCGFTGHTVERCYKMTGFPPNFQSKRKEFASNNHASTSDNTFDHIKNASYVSADDKSTQLFSKEQIAQIMSLISKKKVEVTGDTKANMAVNKLIRDNKKYIGFDEHHCYIQDLPQNRVMGQDLGIGSSDSDLNHLNFFDSPYNFSQTVPSPNDVNHVDSSQDEFLDSHDSGSPSNSGTSHKLGSNPATSDRENLLSSASHEVSQTETTSGDDINSHESEGIVYQVTTTETLRSKEPKDFFEASQDPKWIEVIYLEVEALNRNGTWVLTELPENRKPIGCKWIFKIKYKANGEVERYKARLVAKGNNQKEGIDYEETFSPVVKMVTVRCLISIAVQNGWTLYQLDVNNAFLYGDLVEDVYMTLPPGYFSKNETQVCKLVKSLYGLKQAPRKWNKKHTWALLEIGFIQSKCDYSLYVKSVDDIFIVVLVYVDDIVLTGNKFNEVEKLKDHLKSKFMIKDLGVLKYFLGIEILPTDFGLCLSQRKYCLELLHEFGLLGAKPMNTPIEQKVSIAFESSSKDPLLDNITEYQKLVEKLIYLTLTRPDIYYVVHCLSQYMHAPLLSHLKLAFRTLTGQSVQLLESRLQVSVCFLVVLWSHGKAKKQTTVAKSSAEAEYSAMAAVTCEIMWLHNLLQELNVRPAIPINIFCDNNSALQIDANLVGEEEQRKRDAEEMGDAMKSLENRTLDSKRKMDILSALDEMKSMKSRHAHVSVDSMLEALQRSAPVQQEDKLEEDDEALIKSIFQGSEVIRRINDDELDDDNDRILSGLNSGETSYVGSKEGF
nr:ribonuclease H-like domain-containing protein [Tanacetum cinerariifolium]